MSTDPFPASDFDAWAAGYDADTAAASGFPFAAYPQVLAAVVTFAKPRPDHTILDLGCGTGNLTRFFADRRCQVWGTDFSSAMLAIACRKLPQVTFLQTDIRAPWPGDLPACFDHIVSAFAFHHFDQPEKLRILTGLAVNHLSPGGSITIADIAFSASADQDTVRLALADDWEQEYYWIADQDLPVIHRAGLQADFTPVTPYAGVFHIHS